MGQRHDFAYLIAVCRGKKSCLLTMLTITVFQKNWTTKLMAATLSNLNRFSKFFHC